MSQTLELIETESSTEYKSPIMHAFCDECDNETGDSRGFCGVMLHPDGVTTRSPHPPDMCSMCMDIKMGLPIGECPQGHQLKGLI